MAELMYVHTSKVLEKFASPVLSSQEALEGCHDEAQESKTKDTKFWRKESQ